MAPIIRLLALILVTSAPPDVSLGSCKAGGSSGSSCISATLFSQSPRALFCFVSGLRSSSCLPEAFEKNTGKKYSRDKFKHKWDGLKKEWILWNKLIGSESGLGWDAAKGTISVTDEWWERKLTEVPDAAKFREKGLENVELLDIMFKDTAATGELAWAPTSGVLPDDIETRKEGLGEMSTDTSSPDNNDDDDPNEVETPNPTQPLNPIQPTQDKGKKLALPSSTQGKGKKGGAALKMTQQLSRMCDIVESRNLVISVEPGSTIRNVMERVCTLDGIEKGSELYFMVARVIHMDYNDYIDNSDDHSYDVEDDDELYDLVVAGCHVAVTYYIKYIDKQPCRDSDQTGYKWLMDCLIGNEAKCHEMFRMKPHVFLQLCNDLQHRYGLRHIRHIRLEELVGICLMILGQGTCNRLVQERFQHSGETIHRHFHRVLKRLIIMSMDIIKPSDRTFSEVPTYIQQNPLYMPHFQDCIGAIDGTHIQVVIGGDKKTPYYNRKGVTSFNVMAACDFDLLFTYVMAGWEGAAHDTRIFLDSFHRQSVNFPKPPPGKYYLVDAGYPLRNGYLPPYKGQRYHVADFRRAGRGNHLEERFNYVHSSLRSVIERTFGVWKNRWKILKQMPSYDIKDQRNIIVATCVLHNYIRKHDREDKGFKWDKHNLDKPESNSSEEGSSSQANIENIHDKEMKVIRDRIARSICGL
ncbi:uncharacterized protein LOC142644255 [Castanea sativa]|uniref:uncharacterized protein LOC142644255 n=1 Tax=Castanea sativa TaxID=21020 RepID=UPI003F64D05D